MQEKEKVKNRFYEFVIKQTDILVSIFGTILLVGVALFIYFSFVDITNYQNSVLMGLQNTQDQVSNQQKTIEKLTQNICILQDQIVSLGATPRVQDSSCESVVP